MSGVLESEAVPLEGHCPIHDRTRSDSHRAETHSRQTHFLCLHLLVWFVTTTFTGFAGCVVGAQTHDVPNPSLRPTDEKEPNGYQDKDEFSKADAPRTSADR